MATAQSASNAMHYEQPEAFNAPLDEVLSRSH